MDLLSSTNQCSIVATTTKHCKTIPINLASGKKRFSIKEFLHNTMITLLVYQLLNQSPQTHTQMARALQSSQPTHQGHKKMAAVTFIVDAPTIMA